MRVALMAFSETVREMKSYCPSLCLERTWWEVRYFLSYCKASSLVGVHSKKMWHFLEEYEMKWGSSVTRLAKHWMSRRNVEDGMFITDWIWFLLVSMPCSLTMKPRNLLAAMPKEHFAGLSFMLYFYRTSNAWRSWSRCWSTWINLTSMSSM